MSVPRSARAGDGPRLRDDRRPRRPPRHGRLYSGDGSDETLDDYGEALEARLVAYDAAEMSFEEVPIAPKPDCPVCGDDPAIASVADASYEGRVARRGLTGPLRPPVEPTAEPWNRGLCTDSPE